jgi:hypothetical protein
MVDASGEGAAERGGRVLGGGDLVDERRGLREGVAPLERVRPRRVDRGPIGRRGRIDPIGSVATARHEQHGRACDSPPSHVLHDDTAWVLVV